MNALAATELERFATTARSFLSIHRGHATECLIANLHARVESMSSAAGDLPVSIHDSRAGEAWICSPRTTYADCAGEESARYAPSWMAPLSQRLISSLGNGMAWLGVDRAVSINNWLLSTNLYPPLATLDPVRVVDEAIGRWPAHTIWFRSLNEHDNADWLAALQQLGGQLVASRQVYLYRDVAALVSRHRDLKRDLSLLQTTGLRHCRDQDIVDSDYARIAELYALLYLGKYSRFNPMYGEDFLRRWHRAGLLSFEGYRDEQGCLATVVGLFRQGSTITSPIVGYDTAQPQRMGLYRLATGCAYRASIEHGWKLNFSAGAADFKRLRGGVASIEYSAVFARHLPGRTRLAVTALSSATCRIGVPLLRKYRL